TKLPHQLAILTNPMPQLILPIPLHTSKHRQSRQRIPTRTHATRPLTTGMPSPTGSLRGSANSPMHIHHSRRRRRTNSLLPTTLLLRLTFKIHLGTSRQGNGAGGGGGNLRPIQHQEFGDGK